MVMPEWMSLERMGMISALTLILVQYVKTSFVRIRGDEGRGFQLGAWL